MISIRNAELSDARRLLEIYSYYVRETAVSFEYEPPTLEAFAARMAATMARYPYLVILDDDRIEGYAYAGTFKARAAYDWSCELTIYLDHDARRKGLGRRLYGALESELQRMGILNLYACIASPEREDEYLTHNSADFHKHLGFERMAEFRNCAYKFGRWYHMIWMGKSLGEHVDGQAPSVVFRE